MAKLITKFKYIKPSDKRSPGGYARYIATREGVDKMDASQKLAPATEKQKHFIQKLTEDFPESTSMLEYEDYLKTPNRENASEFISRAIEDHADEIMSGRTYADYIATRPRAERIGSHGLFTDDGVQVKLSKVSEELNMHKGNVWTAIISLRREDADRLGYNKGERWRQMLRAQTQEFSEQLRIPMQDLKWFAAFHNEGHHPHVHLLIYSTNPKQGFLSKKGIDKLRSSIAQEVFHQDLMNIYEKQTEHRDELRAKSRDMISEIVSRINSGGYENPTLEEMLLDLALRLSKTKGKKQYGYLKADVKAMVDEIVRELASDSNIAALYDLWYKKREEIIRTYTDELPKRIPLEDNPEFKSIKNAVIREAIKLARDRTEDVEQAANDEQDEADERHEQDEEDNSRAESNGRTSRWNQANNRANNYAQNHSRNNPSSNRNASLGVIRLMHHLCRMFQNRLDSDRSRRLERIDRKLKRKIDEKKEAHGLKQG